MTISYKIGFSHGVSGAGTNGYKPGARKNETKTQYDAGFLEGMAEYHEVTAPCRAELAKLNLPKSAR